MTSKRDENVPEVLVSSAFTRNAVPRVRRDVGEEDLFFFLTTMPCRPTMLDWVSDCISLVCFLVEQALKKKLQIQKDAGGVRSLANVHGIVARRFRRYESCECSFRRVSLAFFFLVGHCAEKK